VAPRSVDARVRVPREMFPESSDEPPHLLDGYQRVLKTKQRNAGQSVDTLLRAMDEASIDHAIVHAEYEYGDPADGLNRVVAGMVESHPDRLSGYGTVTLRDINPSRAYEQVREVAEMGLAGINIQPGFFRLEIAAKELYPIYAHADELDMTMAVHTGINYARPRPIKTESPLGLDEVAGHFPDLRLIACHAAWPWAAEMAAVARRHPNVYFDFGGMAPKYVARPGTGWDPLFGFLNNHLAGQALFASDWPSFDIVRAAQEWAEIELRDATRHALMGGNAQKLLATTTR
jgi:predicted TIM-barrel fold metal-dependent hydrolase